MTTHFALRLVPLLALVLTVAVPGWAAAQGAPVFTYDDAHPIPGDRFDDPSWCLDEGRHTHRYALDPAARPGCLRRQAQHLHRRARRGQGRGQATAGRRRDR